MGLIEALIDEGHEVICIAPSDEHAKLIQDKGIPFIPLKLLARKGTNPLSDYRLMNEIKSILKKEKIGLVLNYTIKPVIYGTLAAHALKIKVINTVTGLGYSFLSTGIVNRLVKKLYRYSLKFSSVVAFQNQDDQKLFLDNKLVEPSKTTIIPGSGINTSHFKPSQVQNSNGSTSFLFIGRLLYDKGIREFLSAASLTVKQNPTASFDIVGKLDENNPSAVSKEFLNEWTSKEYIHYHGEVNDTRPFIEKSNVVVLPSYREGLPRVMLEAMAMAKPIIASNAPGCRDTVNHGKNGFMVPVKDSETLAQTMQDMVELGNDKRNEMGEFGRKMVLEKFDEQIIIEKYIKQIANIKFS